MESDPIDPIDLPLNSKPSVIHTTDGELFVADADPGDHRVSYQMWDGRIGHLPMSEVVSPGVVRVGVERNDTGKNRFLADNEQIREAERRGGKHDA